MSFKDLRFHGYHIHDEDQYNRAMAAVSREMAERKPDQDTPQGFLPDKDFSKKVSQFGKDYKELGEELLKSAERGQSIRRDEIITLERAEKLYAHASSQGPKTEFLQVSNLEQGLNINGQGLSLSRRLKNEIGLTEEPHRERGRIETVFTP